MSAVDRLASTARNALSFAARGDVRGACAMLDQAREQAAGTVGEDHPEVLAATRVLAGLRRDLGELSDARRLLEEALAAGTLVLGDADPMLLAISHDLATLADELGNRHEARRNFNRLAQLGPEVLGAHHEYVIAARTYLARGSVAPPVTETTRPPRREPLEPFAQTAPTAPVTGYPPDDLVSDVEPAADPPQVSEPVFDVPRVPPPPPPPPPPLTPAAAPFPLSEVVPGPPSLTSPAPLDHESAPFELTTFGRPAFDPADGQFDASVFAPPSRAPFPELPTFDPLPDRPHRRRQRTLHERQSRAGLVALTIVAAMTLLGAAVAAAVAMGSTSSRPDAAASASSTGGPPAPRDLKLRDDGTAITLTWADPSSGTVPFLIAGARADQVPKALHSVISGTTTYTINGLSPTADYCFLVLAVYSAESTATSDLICTHRSIGPSANPTASLNTSRSPV